MQICIVQIQYIVHSHNITMQIKEMELNKTYNVNKNKNKKSNQRVVINKFSGSSNYIRTKINHA